MLRLDLQPLARSEVALLVDSFLGAPAEGAVHRRAFELSEGNALYVREFLADAESCGALSRTGGLWRLSGEPPRFDRLRELIKARSGDLTAAGYRALELLALAAPLGRDELRTLAGSAAIEELERKGLVLVVNGDGVSGGRVALAHPLHGGSSTTSFRSRLNGGSSASSPRRSPRAPSSPRSTSSASQPGSSTQASPTPSSVCARVAACCSTSPGSPAPGGDRTDVQLALRLADAAGPGLKPALQAARARMALDRFAEVEERLAPLEDQAAVADAEQAGAYLRTRALSLSWRGSATEALDLIERAACWRDGRDWSALVAAIRGWSLFYAGRPARAVRELEPLAGQAEIAPPIPFDLLVVLVLVLSRVGLTDRCEALEPEIQALTGEFERAGIETGWAGIAVDVLARIEAARELPTVAGRLRVGIERAERRGDEALAAGISWVFGRLELNRGHTLDAARLLERAAGGLTSGDPRNALGLALADLTRAHATRGDVDAAGAALARTEAESKARPGIHRLALELRAARAWTEVARGRLAAGREQLLALADAAGENSVTEAEATYAALRLGAPARGCAERLSSLADAMQSELSAWAVHARALADRDGRAQLAASERFAQLKTNLFCAEAATAAARALRAEGRQASAREAAALAAKHARRCQGARTPAISGSDDVVKLTSREREIATLAATGASNPQIAEELVLSVRTIETHLYRVFKKLGVGERERLADLLD